jgi:hypothetical protein
VWGRQRPGQQAEKIIRLAKDRWIIDSLPLEYQYRAALPAALTGRLTESKELLWKSSGTWSSKLPRKWAAS